MYDRIKTDITQAYYQQHYPNEGQRFVAWYVRNIHGQDAQQARLCITDGADDKQIDAIVIDEDAQAVYVVQGKFIGSGSVEPPRESRRLQLLREWSHEKVNEVFPRSP